METEDSKICLSCMSVKDVLDIYETHICDGNEEVYADMLKKCFYIELIKESGLSGMCIDCVMRLRDAYYLRQEIIQTITALLAGEDKDASHAKFSDYSDSDSESETESQPKKQKKDTPNRTLQEVKKETVANVKSTEKKDVKVNGVCKSGKSKMKTEEEDIEKIYITCDLCGTHYDMAEALDEHMKMHYLMHCETCGKNFQNERSLYNHVKTHINKPFYCEKCDKSFAKLATLNNHTCQHRDPYLCKTCGQRFESLQKCLRHTEYHHGVNVTKYTCAYCHNCFSNEASLAKHMHKTHPENGHNECTICFKQFRFNRALQFHMRTHDKPQKCKECDKKFLSQKNLMEHMKTHTSMNVDYQNSDVTETALAVEEIVNDDQKYMTVLLGVPQT